MFDRLRRVVLRSCPANMQIKEVKFQIAFLPQELDHIPAQKLAGEIEPSVPIYQLPQIRAQLSSCHSAERPF